jgi:hypothetical protein
VSCPACAEARKGLRTVPASELVLIERPKVAEVANGGVQQRDFAGVDEWMEAGRVRAIDTLRKWRERRCNGK